MQKVAASLILAAINPINATGCRIISLSCTIAYIYFGRRGTQPVAFERRSDLFWLVFHSKMLFFTYFFLLVSLGSN